VEEKIGGMSLDNSVAESEAHSVKGGVEVNGKSKAKV
jgi:hypothetical protein